MVTTQDDIFDIGVPDPGNGDDYEVLPPGTYHATITNIVRGTRFVQKTQTTEPALEFEFTVSQGDWAGEKIWAKFINPSFHEKAKLTKWHVAMFGSPPAMYDAQGNKIKHNVKTVFLNKPCMIVVINKPGRDGDRFFANVQDVIGVPQATPRRRQPMPAAAVVAPPPQAAPFDDDDDSDLEDA